MLRIVLPTAVATADVGAISAIDGVSVSTLYVGISVEIVVDVDVHVIVAPAAVAPTTTPSRSHGHADAERDGHPGRIVTRWRISDRRIGIDRWAVYHSWVIGRYVDDFRIGLFNDNDLLRFDDFRLNFLLFRGFQVAVVLGFLAHALDGVHHVRLLSQERVT